jgi:hydrogenase nickel incorporation protein HypA/HybF
MHELHLAQDILRKIEEVASSKGQVARVKYAKIQLGATRFTHLQELLELFADISGGIRLGIEVLPVKTVCVNCQTEFNPEKLRLDCPKCGATNIQMVSGNELIVTEIE